MLAIEEILMKLGSVLIGSAAVIGLLAHGCSGSDHHVVQTGGSGGSAAGEAGASEAGLSGGGNHSVSAAGSSGANASAGADESGGLGGSGIDGGAGGAAAVDGGAGGTGGACVSLAGIVGWWDGDDIQGNSARDRTINANDGTIIFGVPIVPGQVGNAFQFGAATGAVEIPDATVFALPTAFTIEAWVNPNAQAPTWWRILGKQTDDQAAASSYILGLSPQGTVYFALFSAGLQTFITGDTVVRPGRWSHIAGTWDGTTMRSYLDGVLQTQTMMFVGPPAVMTTLPVRLGKGDGTKYIFNGLVDEITIFNRALSKAEVTSIVSAGAAGKCKEGARL
jgi:hypothetical protein